MTTTTEAERWTIDCVAAAEEGAKRGVLESVLIVCACLKHGSFVDRKVDTWKEIVGDCESDLVAFVRLVRWVIGMSGFNLERPQRFNAAVTSELSAQGLHVGRLHEVLTEYASSRSFYSTELKQAEVENAEEVLLEVMLPLILEGPQSLWSYGYRGFSHGTLKAYLDRSSVVPRKADLVVGILSEVQLPDKLEGGTYTARFVSCATKVSIEQLAALASSVEVKRSEREYSLRTDQQTELVELVHQGVCVLSKCVQTSGSPKVLAEMLRSLLTSERWGRAGRTVFAESHTIRREVAEVMQRNVLHQRAVAALCGPERDPCEASTGARDRLLEHFIQALDGACRLKDLQEPERLLLPGIPAAILAPYVESNDSHFPELEDIIVEGDLLEAIRSFRQRIGMQTHLLNIDAARTLKGVPQQVFVVQTDGVQRVVRDPRSAFASVVAFFPLIDPDELVVRILKPQGGLSTLELLNKPETLTEAQAETLAQIEAGAGEVRKLDETAEADLVQLNRAAELLLAGKLETVPTLTLRDFSGLFREFGLMILKDTGTVLRIVGPPTRWSGTIEFGEMKAVRIAQKELFEHGLFLEVFAVQDGGTLGISLRAKRHV